MEQDKTAYGGYFWGDTGSECTEKWVCRCRNVPLVSFPRREQHERYGFAIIPTMGTSAKWRTSDHKVGYLRPLFTVRLAVFPRKKSPKIAILGPQNACFWSFLRGLNGNKRYNMLIIKYLQIALKPVYSSPNGHEWAKTPVLRGYL